MSIFDTAVFDFIAEHSDAIIMVTLVGGIGFLVLVALVLIRGEIRAQRSENKRDSRAARQWDTRPSKPIRHIKM